jgi:hypothetical protein
MKPTRFLDPIAIAAVSSALGACAGAAIVDHRHHAERQAMIRENYTDRARICLEAAAMLRNHDPDRAIGFLEARTTDAIRGVPMGRSYADLPEKGQVLLVAADRYQGAFPGVDFEVQRLSRDVPGEHEGLSEDLKKLVPHR